MLDHGEAGILVMPRKPEALAAALRRLLDDPALLQEYAARAKRGVERFTVERVCCDMEKVYAELL
jgi:glycosyltransferase involved in cell wall biosynthesis